MFDDMIPEEREERYEQLIVQLRRGLREPAVISSPEQSQIIAQVRERLAQVDDFPSRLDEIPVQQSGQASSEFIVSASAQRARLPRFVSGLVAVLVVGMVVSASLFLFRPPSPQFISPPPIDLTGPTASTQVNGLQISIHIVTQGPYFLSELLSVDLSLTNHTNMPFELDGSNRSDNICFSSALSVQITEGDTPSYTLPQLDIGCVNTLPLTTVAPGQTLTIHSYLPVTKSGEVTILMRGMSSFHRASPLDGHWPSLQIQVASQVPADQMLSLHEQGEQVMIQAPLAARSHLLYMESITCDQYVNGGPGNWSPLSTTALSQPACPTAHKHWVYIVSAPGYSIATGDRDA